MVGSYHSTPKFKLKNILSYVVIIVILLVLTYFQTTIYKLKGSLIVFHALVNLNLIIILVVAIMTIRFLIRIYFERPGSRFRQRLVIAFLISTLLPFSLLFLISTNFIRDTLDKWLNPIFGKPLEDAMSVVRILHKHYQERNQWFGNQLSLYISEHKLMDPKKRKDLEAFIQRKQMEYNLGILQVFDTQQVELTRTINENIPIGEPVSTPSKNLKAALEGEIAPPQLITAGGGTLYRSFIPIMQAKKPLGVIVVNYFSTERLLPKLLTIQKSAEAFNQQMRLRQPIKREYMYLFVIPTLLILFFTAWFGIYLSKGVILPIKKLAEGTQAITNGNLNFKLDVKAYDEIGVLVDSFEKMSSELRRSRKIMEEQNTELQLVNRELDRKQRYMKTLLESFTTGVIGIDARGIISTVNPAAQTMFQLEPQFVIGKNYDEVFAEQNLLVFIETIKKCFETGRPIINKEIHFFSKRITQHLSISISVMKDPDVEEEILGLALVCEDLTELIKVQKVAAWSEVARRIAHEIKNPLTPIRLSAQRIKRKLHKDGVHDILFEDCCSTIVTEVDTIRRLVDSFSRFAKMPDVNPTPVLFSEFIQNLLEGFNYIHPRISLQVDIKYGKVMVNIDKLLLKQAFTNIIDNSIEAMKDKGTLEFKCSYDHFLKIIRLEISDNGPGISYEDRERLFMPYFSTKKRGTGLGLAIVARIIADHYGYIRVADNPPHGTKMIIELPVIYSDEI